MKFAKFMVCFDGTHRKFNVYTVSKREKMTIEHRASLPPFNSLFTGYLFEDVESATEFAQKINNAIDEFMGAAE